MMGAHGKGKCSVNVQGVVICKGMIHAENTCRGWCAAGSHVAHGTAQWVRGLGRVTVAGCLSSPRRLLEALRGSSLQEHPPFLICSHTGVWLPGSARTTLASGNLGLPRASVSSYVIVLMELLFKAPRKRKMIINCNVNLTFLTET